MGAGTGVEGLEAQGLGARGEQGTHPSRAVFSAGQAIEHAVAQGLVLKAPVDLDRMLEICGFTLRHQTLVTRDPNTGHVCMLEVRCTGATGLAQASIGVDVARMPYRPERRFALAVALGHGLQAQAEGNALSLRLTVRHLDWQAMSWDRRYLQAITFAHSLLMPAEQVLAEGVEIVRQWKAQRAERGSPQSLPASPQSVERMPAEELADALARRFEVSTAAMTRRLTMLGVLGPEGAAESDSTKESEHAEDDEDALQDRDCSRPLAR